MGGGKEGVSQLFTFFLHLRHDQEMKGVDMCGSLREFSDHEVCPPVHLNLLISLSLFSLR